MTIHQDTPFQKAIEAVESLPFREREDVLEIIKMRLAEDRREEIAANAREAVQAVKDNQKSFVCSVSLCEILGCGFPR